MTEVLDDEEVRHLAIELLTAPTARDKQDMVGASDLADPCDRCLAGKFAGEHRYSSLSDRTWLGRTLGTATHLLLEQRQNDLAWFRERHPGSKAEDHVWFHEFRGYGRVGGTIDILLDGQIVDPKSSTRKKSALLQDYLQSQGGYRDGLPPRWEHQKRGNYKLDLGSGITASLSATDYAAEMEGNAYKMRKYFGQQSLYLHGLKQMGHPARRASLLYINRDGVGFFDVPSAADYINPLRNHDVWVYSFNYDEAYAVALLERGQAIIDALAAGSSPTDFARQDLCFVCGSELEQEARAIDIEVEFTLDAAPQAA